MVSKLITFGRNRNLALDRMYRALSEYLIRGVKTTIPFHRAIVQDPEFRAGHITTKYVEEFLARTPKDLYTPEADTEER
jgi:acetyl-CoA carboxylase biotin carboxylase subunit